MHQLKIVYLFFANSLQQNLSNIPGLLIFTIAKILRYGLFMMFLYLLVHQISNLQGYSKEQIIFFYLVFNLIDTFAQLLFREVYRFRSLIVSGGFDAVLAKPYNPLLRVLLGGPDFVDFGIFIIILVAMIMVASTLNITFSNILLFILLLGNSLLIATAFHILVLAIGILTLSVDHLVMIYRDLTSLVRIPVDLFVPPLRFFFSFVIPLGIMFTFPAKTLMGLLSPQLIIISLLIGVTSFFLSLKFWKYSLRHYSSASS